MNRAREVQVDRLRTWGWLGAMALLAGLARLGIGGETVREVVRDIGNTEPNDVDLFAQVENYYDAAMNVDRGLWFRGLGVRLVMRALGRAERAAGGEGNWVRLQETAAVRSLPEDGFLKYELVPGAEVMHMGVPVRINRFGMRDRDDYEADKPPGVFRIALVGASNSMGYGVPMEQTYGEVVERRLNGTAWPGRRHQRYEVWNFSVGGYQLLDRLYVIDTRVAAFDPDLVLLVVTMHDLGWAAHSDLAQLVTEGRDLHFDFLRAIAREAGVRPGQSLTVAKRRLSRFREQIVLGAFEQLRAIGEREGFEVGVVVLRLRVSDVTEAERRQADLAEQRVGLRTWRLFEAYEGQRGAEMYLRPSDPHPTEAAHQRLADELWSYLVSDPLLTDSSTR